MTPEYTNQLATELLLSSLMGVLAIGILGSFLAWILLRRGQALRAERLGKPETNPVQLVHYQPSVFEHTCRWLVVKNRHIAAVQSALGLHNPIPCSCGEGLSRLTNRKLFVSPPIRGWILVVGQGLPDPADDVDRCFHFLLRLSRLLGHVQFFSANRALNHHAWIRVDSGHVRRAYAWAGETLWNQGEPTQAEMDLGMKCLRYGDVAEPIDPAAGVSANGNTDKIMLLAARWSFDPTTLNESMLSVGLGVAGDPTHSKQH